MRSEFEKIKDVKERLNLCYFDSDSSGYLPYDRFNYGSAAYVNGAWYAFQHQQSKVDELNQQLESEREETIKGYTKISDLRLERDELQKKLDEYIFVAESIDEMYVREVQKNNELQKRVDAALELIEAWNKTNFDKTTHWTEGYEEGCYHCAAQLEQALKGGEP